MKLTDLLLMILLSIVVFQTAFDLAYSPSEPIEVLEAYARTPVVDRGGILEYTLKVNKKRHCPADYDLVFMSSHGDVKSVVERVTGGKFAAGVESLGLQVRLPMAVVPGEWVLRIIGRARCPEHDWAVRHPDIPFIVVEASDADTAVKRGPGPGGR